MIIDSHCHIDLYNNPIDVATKCENEGMTVIGMTNLPSHFIKGYPHLINFKRVRLALGMHPLYAQHHEKEFLHFKQNLYKTSYIGEVGLDYSREGIATKEIQFQSFNKVLNELTEQKKVLSIHSRKAEKDVLSLLLKYNISNAIFHWYSGPLYLIDDIAKGGYYFSVNPAMAQSKSGQEIIKKIPLNNILPESDGPFVQINSCSILPQDVSIVYNYLSLLWGKSLDETHSIIALNFKRLISKIK